MALIKPILIEKRPNNILLKTKYGNTILTIALSSMAITTAFNNDFSR